MTHSVKYLNPQETHDMICKQKGVFQNNSEFAAQNKGYIGTVDGVHYVRQEDYKALAENLASKLKMLNDVFKPEEQTKLVHSNWRSENSMGDLVRHDHLVVMYGDAYIGSYGLTHYLVEVNAIG